MCPCKTCRRNGSVDLDQTAQSDQGLHCLPRPICPKTGSFRYIRMRQNLEVIPTPDCLADSTKFDETDAVISDSGLSGLMGLKGRSLSLTGLISEWGKTLNRHMRYIIMDFLSGFSMFTSRNRENELPHDKINKTTCAQQRLRSAWASAQADQSLVVRMKKHWTLNYLLSAQWRLWSDWVDDQADLSLRWTHMSFCWFCCVAAQTWLNASIYSEEITLI